MFETTLFIEPKAISLADSCLATIRIVGTTPMKVSVPTTLLDEATSLNWKSTPHGPAKESRDGANYVWQQQYLLSPFIVGEGVSVQFNTFKINDNVAVVPSAQVSITTSVKSLTTADVRPITPLEIPSPVGQEATPVVLILLVLVALGLILFGLGCWYWLRRTSAAVVSSPLERLRSDLQTWPAEASKSSAQELAKRIRDVFPLDATEEVNEHGSRLERWMYSAEVPTAEEMKSELEYWREQVAEQLISRVAGRPTVMP